MSSFRKAGVYVDTVVILLVIAFLFCASCSPYANQTDISSDVESETGVPSIPDSTTLQNTNASIGEIHPYPSPADLLSRAHVMIIEWESVQSLVELKDFHPFISDFMEVKCRVIKTYDGTFEDTQAPSGIVTLIVPEFFSDSIRYGEEALVLTEYIQRLTFSYNDGTEVVKPAFALFPDYSFLEKNLYNMPFLLNVFYIENGTIRIDLNQMFSFCNGNFCFPENQNVFPVDPESGHELPYLQTTVALMFEIRLILHSKGIVVPEFRNGITLEEFDGLMEAALSQPKSR